MGKTLIFGATGNLGGLTADHLHRSSPGTLRVSTSRESGLRRLERRFPDAEAVICDWNDEADLVRAMDGVSRILVIPPDFLTNENRVSPNIIAAARQVGSIEQIVRFIGMPPDLTLDQTPQEYLATRCGAALHVVAKHHLDASGLPLTYVNVPTWIMFNLGFFVATEVKPRHRIAMPASSDSPRMWVSEGDIAAVFARVLSDPAADHIGREHVLTSPDRYTYADVAAVFSDVLGEDVTYADDDSGLRAAMGDGYEAMTRYLEYEHGTYDDVQHNDAITDLLGRPQQTLAEYVAAHKEMFL